MEQLEDQGPKKGKKKAVRHDPLPPDDAETLYILGLKNQDPEMHYVWANSNDPRMGVSRFEMMGYEPVQYQPGGVCPVVGARKLQPGDEIVVEGNLLMCCTKQHKARLDARGGRGSGLGLEWAAQLEQKWIRTHKQGDHMRGQVKAGTALTGRGYRNVTSEEMEQL